MRLNLGAGYDHIDGLKNVDFRPETKPDYLLNLEKRDCLKPIKTNSVDSVYASHLLEHIVHLESLMSEIYRVCKPGAEIIIKVPYWSHQTAVEDPTHVRYFTENSIMYFSKTTIGSDKRLISIPYDFKPKQIILHAEKGYEKLEPKELLKQAKKYLNVIREVAFVLIVQK